MIKVYYRIHSDTEPCLEPHGCSLYSYILFTDDPF